MHSQRETYYTCSIGFACYPFLCTKPDALDYEQVIKIADKALYAAKDSGRNAWVGILSTDKSKTGNLYHSIMNNIEQLLVNGELKVMTSLPDRSTLVWNKPGN